MIKDMIFGTIGGLGLFLFGMSLMTDGLKKVAGQKMRSLLESLTKHRIIAITVGALTTCLIQSSSVTTVMTVGFVNAGLLSLKQALCVVLGANVGTTFTAWLVSIANIGALKITSYTLPAVGIGVLLTFVAKTVKVKSIGTILLGFGILFIGISLMEDAFDPLKESEKIQTALIWLGENPILAVLAGTFITMLIQSSSASIAIIQLLAASGAFGNDWDLVLRVTIPFILGDNIGTTITAQLAAIRTSRNAKRAAMGHTIFNVIGVIYMLPLVWLGIFDKIVTWITPWELSQTTIMVHLAVAHSAFNVFNTVVFAPIIPWLEAIVVKILPITKAEQAQKPIVLENHLLATPAIAINQARREMIRMILTAKEAVTLAIEGLEQDDLRKLSSVRTLEDSTDDFQYHITAYLMELSKRELSDELSVKLPVLLHSVNDLERIGDHAVNIAEITERKISQKIIFSDSAKEEAAQLKNEIIVMFDQILKAVDKQDIRAASLALVNENNLNRMQMEFRRSHVQRMTEAACTPQSGLIFIDLVDNIEKIGDHLTNIAQAVIGGLQWDGVDGNSLTGEYTAITE